jgi:hypothetical protein
MFGVFAVISVLGLVVAAGYIWLRKRYLGTIPISSSSVQYDSCFNSIFTWDKYTFYINEKPVLLLSGEFHYWRLPDQSRWKEILQRYKMGGLNCIRIYFHWGFHSPSKDCYIFDGNRDVEYLLTICEELELFVLACPGPYICAGMIFLN